MKRFSLFFIIIIGFAFLFRPGIGISSASERETELFNKGYEYLFSYKPDKAAETFRLFLKEFPESSARDAAMFWLGKTLISMKLYSEAELTFQAIQNEFPDSPFIVFIDIEMEEIARVRSAGSARDIGRKAEDQKDASSKQSIEEKRPAETEKKLIQIAAEKEKIETLLAEERKANHERQLRIADLESREALLRKQYSELETKIARQPEIEISLKEIRDERDRLSLQLALVQADKNRKEKEPVPGDQVTGQGKISNSEPGESIRLRLSQLEVLAEEQGKELSRARDEQERLKKLIAEEKKFAADLNTDLVRAKEREQEFKTLVAKADERQKSAEKKSEGEAPSARELGKLTVELDQFRRQVNDLQTEKKQLSDRVESMEWQAEQRVRDMRILNAYLTRLMFQKKQVPQQQLDIRAAEERDSLNSAFDEEKKTIIALQSRLAGVTEQRAERRQSINDGAPISRPAASPMVRIMNREYSLSQIIDYQISALLMIRRMGIKDLIWRLNRPLDDFLAEELLVEAARKIDLPIDAEKQKEMIELYKLSPAEAAYLERVMIISKYIDSQHIDVPTQQWIEVLSVDYKPGDAASKTVLATNLQKAARTGTSFREIARTYPDGVGFSRLTPQEFSVRFK
ncbi:MAG: tetratricopeptide repeat protein, partial [Nitrospirota bacterium]|nr:tetratricopeptide repeat protein [Nitrospirota bacterium]